MIAGLLIRNFKTYQGINYIAISNGKPFSALVGENGAGKSSVLEALNCFFNNTEWNPHHSLSKGYSEREPFVCPIFLIKKSTWPHIEESQWFLDKVNEITWSASVASFNPANKPHAELFSSHRQILQREGYNKEDYYLLPFGLTKKSRHGQPQVYFSIFETLSNYAALIDNYAKSPQAIAELQQCIANYYKYIYLPSDIDFKEYTKIESKTIQALLGQKLDTIVRNFIKKKDIQEINTNLNDYIDSLSEKLGDYVYKKPSQKQNLVNQSHLTEKVIEAYFESKVLNKKSGRETTPVGDLSSGEKRQALIDVAKAFLKANELPAQQKIILAVDEPELSLHVSACFGQFEKLRDICDSGVQTIITTHWYGFMPIISDGVAIYCPKNDDPPSLLDLRCFREDIKKLKNITKGELPVEIELKGINDLVQSIIASVTSADYQWLVCEGSADKIYLDHYLKRNGLFIVAVGGSPTVKKIYSYLCLALEDARADVKGRVFCLIDTDKRFEIFDAKESISAFRIRRIKNNEDAYATDLLKTSDNNASPPTVIEDTLNAKVLIKALDSFRTDADYSTIIKKLPPSLSCENADWPSAFALNLNFVDRKTLEDLFEAPGFKVKFALRYIELDRLGGKPEWIKEIESFLTPVKPAARPRLRRSK